jgi:hypothetical protein
MIIVKNSNSGENIKNDEIDMIKRPCIPDLSKHAIEGSKHKAKSYKQSVPNKGDKGSTYLKQQNMARNHSPVSQISHEAYQNKNFIFKYEEEK